MEVENSFNWQLPYESGHVQPSHWRTDVWQDDRTLSIPVCQQHISVMDQTRLGWREYQTGLQHNLRYFDNPNWISSVYPCLPKHSTPPQIWSLFMFLLWTRTSFPTSLRLMFWPCPCTRRGAVCVFSVGESGGVLSIKAWISSSPICPISLVPPFLNKLCFTNGVKVYVCINFVYIYTKVIANPHNSYGTYGSK